MTYTIKDCPINKDIWFAGIRYDNYTNWLENDNIPKPVFNCHPTNGQLVVYNNVPEFRYEALGKFCSISLYATDMNCYVFADTFEEAAQEYNNIIYKYNYKFRMMMRDLNLYRIKNTEGVY